MVEKKEYVSDNARLMPEWDWEKNREQENDPRNLTCGSGRKVWWKCNKGHEWQATIASRNSGYGCPYCAGLYVAKGETDLQTVNPALTKEWDFIMGFRLGANFTYDTFVATDTPFQELLKE